MHILKASEVSTSEAYFSGCPVGLGRSWWFLIILNILLSIEYQLVIEHLRFIKIYKMS